MSKESLVFVAIITFFFFLTIPIVSNNTSTEPPSPEGAIYPPVTGYVADTSGVLSEKTEIDLAIKLAQFDETAQIAVVTIPTTSPLGLEEYAIELAEQWKVGHKESDNGIIFLIVTGDRKLRIEVGRGLEAEINDAKAGEILDTHVVPELKQGNWDAGVIKGIDAIIKEVSP